MDASALLQGLAHASAGSIPFADGDYLGDDGLMHCGVCHTPKQAQICINGTHPRCLCMCAQKKLAEEEEQRKRNDLMARIRELRAVGFPDAEMGKWVFPLDDGTDPRTISVAKRYVANFPLFMKQGKGLLLHGPVGTGKTFAAACIVNALIDQGRPCLMTNFARLANTLQGMFEGRQAYMDSLGRFDLIAIDDLGAERQTDYMLETVNGIIDARYRTGKPLIVTTNLTLQELVAPTDVRKQRIYSRLMETTVPVEVSGADRRKLKLRESYGAAMSLLGLG